MTRSRGLLYLLPRQALDRPAVNFTRAPGNLSCPFSPSGLWCWRLTCCKKSGCKVEPLVLRQRQRKLQNVLRVWTHLGHRSSTGADARECTCVYRTCPSQHLQASAASPLGFQGSSRTRSVRTTGAVVHMLRMWPTVETPQARATSLQVRKPWHEWHGEDGRSAAHPDRLGKSRWQSAHALRRPVIP